MVWLILKYKGTFLCNLIDQVANRQFGLLHILVSFFRKEARDFNGGPLAWFNYASYAVLTLLCIPNSLGWSHITEATQPQRRRVAKKTRWHAKWRKSGSQSEFFPTCPYTMYAPRVLFSGEEEEVDFKSQNILHIQARFFQLPCIFS